MSYDLHLQDDSGILKFEEPFMERGGTYAVGGTDTAEFNITYNYAKIFGEVFGADGIRRLYGMTAEASIPLLITCRIVLGDAKPDADYWAATEGNACAAIRSLHRMAEQAVREGHGDAIWMGD